MGLFEHNALNFFGKTKYNKPLLLRKNAAGKIAFRSGLWFTTLSEQVSQYNQDRKMAPDVIWQAQALVDILLMFPDMHGWASLSIKVMTSREYAKFGTFVIDFTSWQQNRQKTIRSIKFISYMHLLRTSYELRCFATLIGAAMFDTNDASRYIGQTALRVSQLRRSTLFYTTRFTARDLQTIGSVEVTQWKSFVRLLRLCWSNHPSHGTQRRVGKAQNEKLELGFHERKVRAKSINVIIKCFHKNCLLPVHELWHLTQQGQPFPSNARTRQTNFLNENKKSTKMDCVILRVTITSLASVPFFLSALFNAWPLERCRWT